MSCGKKGGCNLSKNKKELLYLINIMYLCKLYIQLFRKRV